VDVWHYAPIKQRPEKETLNSNPSRNVECTLHKIPLGARHTQQCLMQQQNCHHQQTEWTNPPVNCVDDYRVAQKSKPLLGIIIKSY